LQRKLKDMEYSEFLTRIREVKKMGYVKSHREGPTGIGKTLEDLLGLKENNIQGPDFSNYELKASRKGSNSMITLFTKKLEPDSGEKLWETYGNRGKGSTSSKSKQTLLVGSVGDDEYIPPSERRLHSTVITQAENPDSFILVVDENRITIKNKKNVECYYSLSILKETLEKKYASLIHVLADHKKDKGQEYFWFNEAYLYSGFDFPTLMKVVREGRIKVDVRIGHYPDGRVHDHGTGLRISPIYLPECFQSKSKIL